MNRRLPTPVAGFAALACAGCTTSGPPADPCAAPMIICTMAGTGLSQFDGDGRDALSTSLYSPLDVVFDENDRPLILDWNNFRVRRINPDNTLETVIGDDFEGVPVEGALAKETVLHHASDIEFDARGRLYFAGDHVPLVFLIDETDRVRIVAGDGEYGYTGDGGPAIAARMGTPFGVTPAPDGGVYFSDEEFHVIRHVDSQGIITTVAGDGTRGYVGDGADARGARLSGPTRLRLDAVGNLYICDTRNHAIRRLDPAGEITTVVGTGTAGYSGDGGPAATAQLNSPYDILVAPDGTLLIADSGNNVVRSVALDGTISTVLGDGTAGYAGDEGPASTARLDRPSGLARGPDDSLWIADTFNNRIRRVTAFFTQP